MYYGVFTGYQTIDSQSVCFLKFLKTHEEENLTSLWKSQSQPRGKSNINHGKVMPLSKTAVWGTQQELNWK